MQHPAMSRVSATFPYGFFQAKAPLPALADILNTVRIINIPMRTKFRGVAVRYSALIQGPAGWGEFAPFTEYGDSEAAAWLSSALEAAWLPAPKALRTSVPVNATLPAVPARRVPEVLGNYDGEIQELKIKVAERGQSLAEDIARVSAARRELPRARLKIDANAGWDAHQALRALRELSEYGLIYAEQPVATIADMVYLRKQLHKEHIPVLLAADELVRKAHDPLLVARSGAADVLVIKVAPLAGIARARAVIERAGLPVVISSALESSVGIATGVHLAASLPELPYGCGLGTVSLMKADITTDSLVSTHGTIAVRSVAPDSALLARYEADKDTRMWWLERIQRCYRILLEEYEK